MKNSVNKFVGTWEQVEGFFGNTTVVYTIGLRRGRLSLSGVDKKDGEKLKISDVRWNGKDLRFSSYVRSTNWKTRQIWRVKRNGVAEVLVTYTDSDREVWKKRARV